MREIVYLVAASLDGFIADADGAFDAFPFDAIYGAELLAMFPETLPAPYRAAVGDHTPNQQFDTVLMGRSTYELGSRVGLTSPYPTLSQYVVSQTMTASPDPAVRVISGDTLGQIRRLQQEPGRSIWLCGGGKLAATLLQAGVLSQVWIKLNPVVFGTGIPLFNGVNVATALTLESHHAFSGGRLLLRYRVGS